MFRFFKYILLFCIVAATAELQAQTTTSSTYSQFGPGLLNRQLLPQTRAMGGISAAYRMPGSYNNINMANPAQYSSIRLTVFDGGLGGEYLERSNRGGSEKDFTGSLSHLAFGIPVTKKSAMSFGLIPYSSLGYQSRSRTAIDTNTVDYIFNGDGGISKAYLGYGIQLGKHLSVGGNISYVFGKLERVNSYEFAYDPSAYSSREVANASVGGFNFDYGVQYFTNLSGKVRMTLGYAGTATSKIRLDENAVFTRYTKGVGGEEGIARDTLYSTERENRTLTIPLKHTFGFAIESPSRWMIGADFRMSDWSKYRENNSSYGYMAKTTGVSVGGQITPDINSVGSYFKVIDYRLGFSYDKTNLRLNNTDIKQMAITFGLGLPLQSSITRTTFYKINLAAELGQRGTLENSLVRERYVNIHLGFTLNDTWFRKYKFD